MRLLFVIDNFGSGGAQRQMVKLALGLKGKDHDVEFFIYYPQYRHFAGELEKNGIVINSVKKKFRFNISIIGKLRKHIKHGKYDCVVSFLGTPNIYSELTRIGVKDIPLIVSERNTYPYGKISIYRKVRDQLHRLATHITTNSHYQREKMENLYPWIRRKITTIYNGVDTNEFKLKTNKNYKQNNDIKLLVVASIRYRKNMIGLAKSLKIYSEEYGNPPVIRWAGKQFPGIKDINAYNETNKILKENGLQEKWEWLGERDDIPDLLQEHDALILPSFYEGLPNAVCEALSTGIPVLVSKVCDHPRLVEEGKTGFLFNPYNSAEIAKSIHRFVKLSTKEKIRFGKAAREYAVQELSLDAYVSQYESLIKQLIATKRI